jgi:curved DNA-binding protein CbpA
MKRYHPDSNGPGATNDAQAKAINEAYRVLRDPRLRGRYDRDLAEGTTFSNAEPQKRREEAFRTSHVPARPAGDKLPNQLAPPIFIGLAALVIICALGSFGAGRGSADSGRGISSGNAAASSAGPAVSPAPADIQPSGSPPASGASPPSDTAPPSGAPLPSDGERQSSAAPTPAQPEQEPSISLSDVTPENQPFLRAAVAQALNTGQSTPWSSADRSLGGMVLVSRAVISAGQTCRTFRFTVTRTAERRTASDIIACLSPGHNWLARSTPSNGPASSGETPPF